MTDDLKFWYLRDHKLFEALDEVQIQSLCVVSGFKEGIKGDEIHFSKADQSRIFLLKKGNIKIIAFDEDGNETIKEILKKGDLFGELSLNINPNGNEYAKVLSDEVSLCSFLISDFEKILIQNPTLALNYTKFVGLKMMEFKNNYANLVSKDAKSRLIIFLKEWATREGKKEGDKYTIQNYLTQTDIAQIICTSRQTTTVLMKELEDKNLIYYNRNVIMIDNIHKL